MRVNCLFEIDDCNDQCRPGFICIGRGVGDFSESGGAQLTAFLVGLLQFLSPSTT